MSPSLIGDALGVHETEPQQVRTPQPGLTRRDALVRGAGAVVLSGVAVVGGTWLYDPVGDAGLQDLEHETRRLDNYFDRIDFPASSPRVSVAVGSNDDNTERLVRTAVHGLDADKGMARFISRKDVVLIKPNIGFDRPPRLAATTNPEVVRSVVRLCRDAGAREIIVADNPIESPEACFAKSGIRHAAVSEGAKVILPARTHFEDLVIRPVPPDPGRGEALGRWSVFYRPLVNATKVIGVAPIKDHNLCSASMNLKNFYGLLGGRRNQFHQAIHDIISDLALMMSPTLVIADGTRVMMRNGPTGGRPSDVTPGGEIGKPTVVASVDPVACDAWCYRHLLGRDPAKLAYLHAAEQKIKKQIAEGWNRFATSDWQAYQRQGLIKRTGV
ncbi:MAG: DUF362 domain-containing protein [Phycisphaerae bacterium]|jgi:uncharacterized protein (DUF362 family)